MLINLPVAYIGHNLIKAKSLVSLLLLVGCVLCVQSQHKNVYLPFNNNWKVEILEDPRSSSDIRGKSFTTSTPTNIHLDLLKHNRIDDPYFGANVLQLTWLAQCKIKYSKQFTVDQANQGRAAEIVFFGIDTFATVSINGKVIIKANNAHRTYSARIENQLNKQKTNLVEVLIESTSQYEKEQSQKFNQSSPYAYVRKPVYQYGGEWTPNLVTMGIWQSVELRFYDEIRLDYVWVRNKIISDERAILNFATKFNLNLFKNQTLLNNVYVLQVYLKDKKIGSHKVVQETAYIDITIENPKLWWPNGIGQPYLYNFTVYLTKHNERIDHRSIHYGIRSVQLNLQSKNFELKVNGYPIYCKGANYMPMDMLYPRLQSTDFTKQKSTSAFSSLPLISNKPNSISSFTVEKLLEDAVDSNFNMLRIWGGGNYESDHFIYEASKKGIMIFYDFMFSQSSYPIQPDFLENVEEEVKDQIKRVRNYPSIVIWNGNDQVLYKLEQKSMKNPTVKRNFQKVFDKLIRQVVSIENPYVPYIATSPIYGSGSRKFQEKGGDAHLWAIWGNKQPFENLYQTIPRFTTEFGVQSLPLKHTLSQFMEKQEDAGYASTTLQAHQRHYSNFTTLTQYLQKYFRRSTHFEFEIYLSGVMQAHALEIGIIAQRTAKQKSNGCLYWSFNEPWPSVSMATVDYYGRWKAAQYVVKRAFSNIAVFTLPNNSVIAINDNLYPAEVNTKLLLIYLNGTIIHQEEKSIKLDSNSAKIVFQIEASLVKNREKEVMAYTQIYHNHTLMMRSSKFYSPPRDLTLMKAILRITIEKSGNQFTVTSNRVIKSLFINSKKQYVRFSDNYFDLVPGFPIEIKIITEGLEISELQKQLQFYSVRQSSLESDKLEVVYK